MELELIRTYYPNGTNAVLRSFDSSQDKLAQDDTLRQAQDDKSLLMSNWFKVFKY